MLPLTAFVVQVNILAVRMHGLGERDVDGKGRNRHSAKYLKGFDGEMNCSSCAKF